MYIEREYLKLLKDILSNGVEKQDRTGTGTLSVFGRQIRHSMSKGFPLLTTKKMPMRLVATELLWFLRGDTNIKFLHDYGCHIWDGDYEKSGRTDGELGPIYGKQWRDWNSSEAEFEGLSGVDQIANLISELKTNPDSRRLMVNAWNVGEIDHMTLPPCHYGFQIYTRELSFAERVVWMKNNTSTQQITLPQYIDDKFSLDEYFKTYGAPTRAISLMWNQRSVDTFLGLPFNIASYALLLEIIAKATNMVPDELIGNLGDVHLYSNHIEQAKEQLTREPMPLSKLNINTEFWPTESGSCGEGILDAVAIFDGFKDDNFCRSLLEEDIQLSNYQSHPAIKAPLSN
jgi:thymidylate synthase